MAYREVRMMDIDQVMRRWLAGESIRAVARSRDQQAWTGRRLIRLGQQRINLFSVTSEHFAKKNPRPRLAVAHRRAPGLWPLAG